MKIILLNNLSTVYTNEMQYWKTHKKDIILLNFKHVLKSQLKATLWQQHGGHRETFVVKFTEADKKNCQLKILDGNIDLYNPDAPFYAHIKELDVLFKKDNYHFFSSSINFSLPGELQLHEKRRTRRFYYQYQDHKNITFRSIHNKPNTETPLFIISSVLVDISTTGAGMVVNGEIVKNLVVGQSLLLNNLTDQELPTPFKVKIVYIENYNHLEHDLYKVGLIFDDQLNAISYKSISSIIEIKQKKIEGLDPKRYCGLDEEDQVQTLNKVESTNKVLSNNLKDNIEYLDKLRYMTTQMKVGFLKSINHELLAVALRLSSKELVYELFSEVSMNMKDEFLDKLQDEKPASAVCKAQDQIIKEIRDMEKSGEVVLDPKAFVTYV